MSTHPRHSKFTEQESSWATLDDLTKDDPELYPDSLVKESLDGQDYWTSFHNDGPMYVASGHSMQRLRSVDDCAVLGFDRDWAFHLNAVRYFYEDELSSQIEMLPNPEEVSTVVSQLDTDDLREFATAIMNASVDSAYRGRLDLVTIRFLNGWFASMEEMIAAGDDLEEILSRRWSAGSSDIT